MGLSTALYTGLSGLTAASQMISVSGNNIANVNTTAYKTGRANFQTQISQMLKNATAPTAALGGSNPAQMGLGVKLDSITRDFADGATQITGANTDVALEGKGFFVLNVNGQQMYTRSGRFGIDSTFNLVSAGSGGRVQGYGVDGDFNIIQGVLRDINIPLGSLTISEATSKVFFKGNLNAAGNAATQGSVVTLGAIFSDALGTTPALATDNLTALFNSSGSAMFQPGDVITITGVTKGTATLPDYRFEVTDPGAPDVVNGEKIDGHGATLQDFMNFLDAVLGIDNLTTEGVSIDGSGQLIIQGNTGEVNNLIMASSNLVLNQGSAAPSQPFEVLSLQEADGESVRTTFVTYDSLGNEMLVDLAMVLESKSNTGTTWRYYAQSADDTDLDRVLGSGLLTFDNTGRFTGVAGGDSLITLDRNGTGADTPQTIQLMFEDGDQRISALADTISSVSAVRQDGYPIGTLEDFTITTDGTIVGVFSNSMLRNLGQIVLATFANPGGLVDVGGSMFNVSPASGNAMITTPGKGGTGRTIGNALEGSNVDLSAEFINLISASTGFSASSRVLTTSNQLIEELLASVR